MDMAKRSAARQSGFSLLELMITIAVIAVLLAIAVPSFRDVIRRNQISSASNELLASIAYARTEAIDRGQLVSMCPSSSGTGCTGGTAFEPGWIIYTYPAGAASANEKFAGSAILLRTIGARSGVSIQSNDIPKAVITFGLQGQLRPGTPPLGFVTCARTGASGIGESTQAARGVGLNVNGSGSVATTSWGVGAECKPQAI